MMNSFATVDAFFSGSFELPEACCIYYRMGSLPLPICLTLINVNELERQLHDTSGKAQIVSMLSLEEQDIFASFSYPKRKREWLGGRLAAKTAVLKLLGRRCTLETLQKITILPSENGSPLLHTPLPVDRLPALSISHSDRFAVAMAADAISCGVDIQIVSEKTERVVDRFCEPDELRLLRESAPNLDLPEQLTLLWTAKEALKKAILHDQPVIFKGVTLLSMETDTHCSLQLSYPGSNNHAGVTVVQIEDCMFSYTIVNASHA